ncbi:endonuclease YncB(thermonuclease family) [Roseibium hamelinense]|uniref:Endonuclease YncB(Thermonuclease family) n=1 Tax=Roseibium hamelinense TaxID=150831 RepID=A0A562THZ0_9HYPH|nr:thermonuclease family protein [Roseibium hamelinense]MTI42683.1 thermonuclease family protein [Roseibium hamelinense]TWI93309.1 endonuclease YncB(thermonuclease family) [Roseibium hamelinense]
MMFRPTRGLLACALALTFFCALPPAYGAQSLRVVDGDTLELDGEKIRLAGIDAPELGQTCLTLTGTPWRCGQSAKKQLQKLAKTGPVECRGAERDAYGRRIATCFSGGRDLNAALVRSGYAFAFVKYDSTYEADEQLARQSGAGVWAGVAEAPWDYRAAKWQSAGQTAPQGCTIKGNISSRGRIYHMPWSPSYARTRINEAKGERWFCSEDEALAAGWRAARGS